VRLEDVMHRFRLTATALLLCSAVLTLDAQKQLALIATVSPASGSDTSITARDVSVTENGAALGVSKVELLPRLPKLLILIDNGSGLPASALGELRNSVKAFLREMPPGLETTLITTAPQGRTLQAPTTDRERLLMAVDRIAPDAGTGAFVESVRDAMERIDKDKDESAAYAVVNVATTSGNLRFRENDVKMISEMAARRHPVVYTVLLNVISAASLGGAQIEIGKGLAEMTGGRFETIGLTNRLTTLLPEIGATVAKLLGNGTHQLRVMVERSTSGPLGQVRIDIPGLQVMQLTLDAARTK
jgi:hypothetical protein